MSVEGIANADANSALDTAIVASTTYYIQLHTGHPGAAGTTSIATESTREAVTFGSASAGVKTSTLTALWSSVAATETYAYFTIWTAASAGTFKWSGTISGGGVTAGQDFEIASGNMTLSFAEAA